MRLLFRFAGKVSFTVARLYMSQWYSSVVSFSQNMYLWIYWILNYYCWKFIKRLRFLNFELFNFISYFAHVILKLKILSSLPTNCQIRSYHLYPLYLFPSIYIIDIKFYHIKVSHESRNWIIQGKKCSRK